MKEFIKYKLTKKKSIEITIELWKWLEENPIRTKQSWPGWLKYDYLESECACCEYVERKTRNQIIYKNCEKYCPLIMLWPYQRDLSLNGRPIKMSCEQGHSIFKKWDMAQNIKMKVKYARELWQGAEKILIEMNK